MASMLERMMGIEDRLRQVEESLDRGDKRMDRIEGQVQDLTRESHSMKGKLDSIETNTQEIIDLFRGSRLIASILRWTFVTLAAVGGSVATVKIFMGG
jgi:archaellum component FlaC